jgi:hypothetical protein
VCGGIVSYNLSFNIFTMLHYTAGETAKRRNGETAKRRNGETAKRRNGETAKIL